MERRLPPPASSNTEPGAAFTYSATHLWRRQRLYRHGVRPRSTTPRRHPAQCAPRRSPTPTRRRPSICRVRLSSMACRRSSPEGLPAFSARQPIQAATTSPRWTWADGTADTVTAYLNAPPIDPDPSPSINPRDVTDSTSHTFGQACLYGWLQSLDDDAGSASSTVKVMWAAAGAARAQRWQTELPPPSDSAERSRRQCYLLIVGFMSTVFNEATDVSTGGKS